MSRSSNRLDVLPLTFQDYAHRDGPDDADWDSPAWDEISAKPTEMVLPYAWLDMHSAEQADVLSLLVTASHQALEGKALQCCGDDKLCSGGSCLSCNVAWAMSRIEP